MPVADVRVREVVPRPLRRRAAAAVGRYRGARLRERLRSLAESGRPIVAGPWLGEVGFEILYWAPFLRWFAREFGVSSERITVVSRGGTAAWYGAFAGRYQEVFDHLSPSTYREWQEAHRREIGEQKQTRITVRERDLLDRLTTELPAQSDVLHPSMMYELLNPYWWQHLDEGWVHRHTAYELLEPPPRTAAGLNLPESYTAAKFYFNDCFPSTEQNRAFVRDVLAQLVARGPVVSLSAGLSLDDHGACAVDAPGLIDIGVAPPSRNLQVQTAVVAHASAFVGTYGGFAYLAPFYGVRSLSYYDRPDGFARTHLRMANSAFRAIGVGDHLRLEPISAASPREQT